MINKLIKEELVSLEGMLRIVETYEEIAAIRTRRVKHQVLQNREFLSGLNTIFQKVEHSYKKQIVKLRQKRGKSKIPSVSNNGRTCAVLVTANTGLYGKIIKEVFDLFISDTQGKDIDTFVLGKLGRKMCDTYSKPIGYKYFNMSDAGFDEGYAREAFNYLINYEKVVVYHGIFKDMLNQIPTKSFIARDVLETENIEGEKLIECIFEPSLENIVAFFERQILSSIFDQTLFESDLSKYSSRMINLDLATVNITNTIKSTKLKNRKAIHRSINGKQLSTLGGLSLWNS